MFLRCELFLFCIFYLHFVKLSQRTPFCTVYIFKSFVKHLVIGVDYIPSDNFWLGIGYNPKTALDMKLQGSNALAGFSGGAGVRIKMFDVGVSVAKYHPSALSMMLSISTTISDF